MSTGPRQSGADGTHWRRLPVVVTGADLPGGLGIARALRNEDVPVYGLALDTDSPCCRSTGWTEVSAVAEDSDRAWLDALDSIGNHHPRLALMISQDTVVETVVRHAELLRRRYEFVLPDPGTVRLLGDKTEFAVWAHAQGFPLPRTHVVTSQEELDTALHQVRYPAVLKPFRRDHRWHAASGRTKAHLLDSPEAAGELPFRPFDASSRYVLQEWIDGGDSDVHFCLTYRDRTGGELGRKTGRKIVQWPIGTGNTAICTTTDDPVLSELTTDLFDRAGLVGLGSLEVKRDRRDGRYYITEPTVGRPNLQSNVAAAAGTNLIAIAYHDACRSAIPSPRHHRQAIWLSESYLPPALLLSAARRQLDLATLLRSLLRARSLMLAYAGRGDLRPLGALLLGKIRTLRRYATRRRRGRHDVD